MSFINYISSHKEVSDVLITGGDPMIMNVKGLSQYILPFLEKGMEHVRNIRIGSKSLTYWHIGLPKIKMRRKFSLSLN